MAVKKTALITGATGGLGEALVMTFAANGYDIVIHYNRNREKAESLVEQVVALGQKATAFQADIGDFEESETLVKHALDTFGHLDVLINNAGITKDTLMLRMKEADFDAVINTNLKGTWNMIKHVTRTMFKQKGGRIINISSVVGLIGNPGQANYVASKAGIIGMTKALAKEYGKKAITVNAIAPGFINTEMTEQLGEDIKAAYLSQIPLNRFGEANDVAGVALFLASQAAGYISGQTISVNGGMI